MDQVAVSAIALATLVVAVLILVWMTSAKQVAPGWRAKSSRRHREKFTPPGSPYIAAGPLRNFPPPGYFGTDTCGPCDNYNPQPEWKFMAPKTGSTKGDSCC